MLRRLWSYKYDNEIFKIPFVTSTEVPFEEFFNDVLERSDFSLYQEGNLAALVYSDCKNAKTGKLERIPDPSKMHRIIMAHRRGKKDVRNMVAGLSIAAMFTYGVMRGTDQLGRLWPSPPEPSEPTLEERIAARTPAIARMTVGMLNGELTLIDEHGYFTKYRGAEKLVRDLDWLHEGVCEARELDAALATAATHTSTKMPRDTAMRLADLYGRLHYRIAAMRRIAGDDTALTLLFTPWTPKDRYEPDLFQHALLASVLCHAAPEDLAAARAALQAPLAHLARVSDSYQRVRERIANGTATARELEPLIASFSSCSAMMERWQDDGTLSKAADLPQRMLARIRNRATVAAAGDQAPHPARRSLPSGSTNPGSSAPATESGAVPALSGSGKE
jgi:hypothetical protein